MVLGEASPALTVFETVGFLVTGRGFPLSTECLIIFVLGGENFSLLETIAGAEGLFGCLFVCEATGCLVEVIAAGGEGGL